MTTDTRSSSSEPRTLVSHPELKSHQSFPFFKTIGEAAKTPLDKLLSLFADVRAGEGVGALLLLVNVFLLLAGYSILKVARDSLALQEVGAEVKSYLSAAQAVVLIGVLPLYGWLATRVRRIRLIASTSIFFTVCLVLFYLCGRAGLRVGVAFYIWMGIFNVFVISQAWALANDLYSEGQGRRLFPMIGVGASLGAWVGAASIGPLVKGWQFDTFALMLAGPPVLMICFGLMAAANRRETARAEPAAAKTDAEPLGKEGGFELIRKDRYLFWIAVLIFVLNTVNTTGQFILDKLLEGQGLATIGNNPVQLRQFNSAFYGSLNANANLVGFLLQLFAASRVIRFMGVRGALFILPIVALVNYSIIAVVPLLAVVQIGKILENSTDYSIQNTIRHALFLPTSREAKYKAKATVDTFFTRGGDALSALFIKIGSTLGVGVGAFAWLNVALTAGWLIAAGRIAREHRKRTL